ncbi:hypothetical protein ACMZ7Q_01515 [Gardnerella vaginalis]|uniref:hypothetical protein n=1 Tax=Gardnerella vaginalis TaxID=2702 RepID=UPI0039F105EE
MKRFTKALLTFACAASIVIGIPTCAYAEEYAYSGDVKPNVITTMMHRGKAEEEKYWMGQNDTAKISNVKVTDIKAHSAKISFDYELFNVKDLKKISFIVYVRKFSKIMITSHSLRQYAKSFNAGDVDPDTENNDKENKDKDKDKKKDSEKEYYKIEEENTPFSRKDPASGYVRGVDYYSYGLPDKLPTEKKGHATVEVATMPATKYTNTQGLGDIDKLVRVENGKITKPIKPFIDSTSLAHWMADRLSLQNGTLDKPIDIDVSSTYVGLHADYKNGSAIYFNNNAVQVPTFTTLKDDSDSHGQLGNNGDNNTAENASANSNAITQLQRAFNRNPLVFTIVTVLVILLVAICVVLLVRRSLSKKKAIANEKPLTAEETAEKTAETSETETSETEGAAESTATVESTESTETLSASEQSEV